ncbi:MAG: hypothetical protein WC492_03565 [Candidatus Micrarchaeia archaeon]
MKKFVAFLVFAMFSLCVGFIYSLPVGGTSVTAGTPVTLGTISAGTASAWGGNITQVNLTINSTTLHWQGFYGSTTASLRLAAGNDSNLSTLKVWNVSTLVGQIYVSRSSNVDFTKLNSTSAALTDVDNAFSFLNGANDAAASTGSDSSNPAFTVGQYQMYANRYPLITTLDNSSGHSWKQVITRHASTSSATDFVFVGILNNSGIAFNGDSANFQVIVPENSAGDDSATTYYFYGEVQ